MNYGIMSATSEAILSTGSSQVKTVSIKDRTVFAGPSGTSDDTRAGKKEAIEH
jgi:hypothetical protein